MECFGTYLYRWFNSIHSCTQIQFEAAETVSGNLGYEEYTPKKYESSHPLVIYTHSLELPQGGDTAALRTY